MTQASLFESSCAIIQCEAVLLFKSKTSNLYFLDIFPADVSGELLPAAGGRQDGKEDSVKSADVREAVVTC